MLRNLLLSVLATLALSYVARGPAPSFVRTPALSRATLSRPMAPTKPALAKVMMGLGEAVEQEVCIEDEAIEECVIAKWDAGEIKVRLPPTAARFPHHPPLSSEAHKFHSGRLS
jgi:hypothetical protein